MLSNSGVSMSDGEETISKAEHLRRLAQKQERITALEAERDEARAAAAAAYTSKLEAELRKATRRAERYESDLERISAEFAEFRGATERSQTLTQAGIIDPDQQDLVLYRYGRLAEDQRPELSEYLAEDGAGRSDAILSQLVWGGTTEPAKPARVAANGRVTRPSPAPGHGDRAAIFLSKPVSYRTSPEGRAEWAAIRDEG